MGKIYRLFISHSWKYPNAYQGICSLLNEQNFLYYNHSVPQNDPIHTNGTDKQLYEAIKNKMNSCNCILILAGVYCSYSKWIDKEIKIAKEIYGKPIIAIEPWGSERTSKIVKNNADLIVKWQGKSIVEAIKNIAI
ncbi:TIR domain-containing protein [Akkermansia muciniphila]|jgi:hypothetical protein|uniref:Molecular chaperone Tir n=1 Tax=Akkermansia muciniphila TaxID=239935 RepID=A0A2N8HF12_9BACT|nr:TIR domain-containing protein [Akkermansia muciniphila]PNC18825.1 molecular chaperone Tir [Akkermansia muciniphila]